MYGWRLLRVLKSDINEAPSFTTVVNDMAG